MTLFPKSLGNGTDLDRGGRTAAQGSLYSLDEMMDYRNRLPADFMGDKAPEGNEITLRGDASVLAAKDPHARDAAATLLRLLTVLANCGLDAGAPPLLQKAATET